MSAWIKVLNSMPQHPKVLAAGDRASWLHVCGLCYSNEHLTDGYIARHALPIVAPGVKRPEVLAGQLVDAGLWHDADGGWIIHDYRDHQRSADDIREQRRRDAERKATTRSGRSPTRSPNGSPTGSPPGHNEDVREESERRVEESREEERRKEKDSQRAVRAASRHVNQEQLPPGFPEGLEATAHAVLRGLAELQAERGGDVPSLRGVGLVVQRFADRDVGSVLWELRQWALAGRGQRRPIRDWPRMLASFLERAPAGSAPTVTGGRVVPFRRDTASDWLQDAGFVDGEPIADAEIVEGEAS